MVMVAPTDLHVEAAYQRDLSGKSVTLIRKIVANWDWAKFKPPVCAKMSDGYFVIDGQHTAIAAATHPMVREIPIMVVSAERIERRAEAFVSHNRDRLTMTPAQIFHGEIAAGNFETLAIFEIIKRVGAAVPRLAIQKYCATTGQIAAVGELHKLFRAPRGPQLLERVIRIAVVAKVVPISATVMAGLRSLLTEERFASYARLLDAQIAAALASIKNIEATSQHFAAETGQSRYRACAALLASALDDLEGEKK
jgi:hypothetical protein